MANTLRVGIIGASAAGGWARDGHVPAVQALDGLLFAAVATNSQKTADASARAFGVPAAFGSGMDLIRAPDIDLVTVATRVPDHRNLVLAAIAAGKHVYCEWPLGRDVAEAEELTAAARAAGVHVAVGLQLRGSPVVRRAREMIASGAIGRVLSVSVQSATAGFGPDVPAPFVYLEDPASFANLVTIQGAHTIDLAVAVAGALGDGSALATAQYPEIRAGDDREVRKRVTYDHLLLQGRLVQGGTLAVAVAGGRPPEPPSHLEVVGETGTLRLGWGRAARRPVGPPDAVAGRRAAARGRGRACGHARRGGQRFRRVCGAARRHRRGDRHRHRLRPRGQAHPADHRPAGVLAHWNPGRGGGLAGAVTHP